MKQLEAYSKCEQELHRSSVLVKEANNLAYITLDCFTVGEIMLKVAREGSCIQQVGECEVDKETLNGGGIPPTDVEHLKQECSQAEEEAGHSH